MSATGRLQGKVCLVTGAARGIGAAIAKRFALEGARVFAADLTSQPEPLDPGAVVPLRLDVGEESDWRSAIAAIRDRAGALHVLVNNAGVSTTLATTRPDDVPLQEWRRIHRVNAEGTFLGCKTAFPLILASGGGSIINIASLGSMVAMPFDTAYGASKAAVQQLSLSVAMIGARSRPIVRCNSIHPGQIWTDMWSGFVTRSAGQMGVAEDIVKADAVAKVPMGRYGDPTEVASLALFLAGDESAYITGQAIVIDGGIRCEP